MSRHFKSERLGGLEIDDEFEFGRVLHWQICWLFALEDTRDIACGATVRLDRIAAVRHQAAGDGEQALRIDRRQAIARHQRNDHVTMGDRWPTRCPHYPP